MSNELSSSLPYVFIFDIDHCLIGEVGSTINEKDIVNLINKKCKIQNILNECNDTIDIVSELNNGLLRPDFKKFINYIKKKYKHVELFIYTKSSYAWANNVIVVNIENASGVKFNKPFFTRENTSNNQKLLGNIYETIINELIEKYPGLKEDINKKKVFNERLVFIDDIENNLKDYPKKQIVCPEYNYRCYYDIQSKIIKKYKVSKKHFDDIEILQYFENNDLPLYSLKGSKFQQDKIYQNIIKLSQERYTQINNNFKDTFFTDLIKILKTVKIFDEKTIEKINKALV
jgi:hypothetical protein